MAELIQDHEDYPKIIDSIEEYGELTKKQLVDIMWDDSGEGETKKELGYFNRAQLLSRAVDAVFGGTCQ